MPGVRTYLQPRVHEAIYGFNVTRTIGDLDDYQHWMTKAILDHPAVMIAAFMGAGKTASAILAVYRMLQHYQVKTLVIAPLEVAKNTWPDEFLEWDFARDMTYSVIIGDAARRAAAVRSDADVHIINRENIGWLVKHCDGVLGGYWPWNVLIYDEASRLKSGSDRTKNGNYTEFGWVKYIANRFWKKVELSGTPSPNGLIDLWGPMFVLDHGQRLGKNVTAYRDRWFKHNSYTNRYEPHDHSFEEITGRLKDIMFYLREDDHITLPPFVIQDRFVRLDDDIMAKYRAFKSTLVFEEFDIEAANNAVLVNKLLQFANGSVYDERDELDTGPPEALKVHNQKLHELDSILNEVGGRPVLIMYSYKFDLWEIRKKYPWMRVFGESNSDLADWNAGKIRAMLMHPASAAHGLNFQYGGNIAVWYGLNWSLELYLQAMRRIRRRGQKSDRVWIYRILARDTEDERVSRVLAEKDIVQDSILEEFHVSVERIRGSR